MKRRLASILLLLVLFGGAFAGVPLSFGESHCCMGGMMEMECCKAMRLQQGQTKFTHEEELLCALNCAQNETTLPSTVLRTTPPAQSIQSPHPPLTQPPSFTFSISRVHIQTHGPPGSPPAYLRNLTLLI